MRALDGRDQLPGRVLRPGARDVFMASAAALAMSTTLGAAASFCELSGAILHYMSSSQGWPLSEWVRRVPQVLCHRVSSLTMLSSPATLTTQETAEDLPCSACSELAVQASTQQKCERHATAQPVIARSGG